MWLAQARRAECEPRSILGRCRFAGTAGDEVMVAVKKRAVGGEVIKDAVKNDPHSILIGVFRQVFPILLRAEVRIDLRVVPSVVSMVRGRVKDWIEIQRVYP